LYTLETSEVLIACHLYMLRASEKVDGFIYV